MSATVQSLPSALASGEQLRRRLAGHRLAVFLDYDGTLTPIVDRPQDAVISPICGRLSSGWPSGAPSVSSADGTGPLCSR